MGPVSIPSAVLATPPARQCMTCVSPSYMSGCVCVGQCASCSHGWCRVSFDKCRSVIVSMLFVCVRSALVCVVVCVCVCDDDSAA